MLTSVLVAKVSVASFSFSFWARAFVTVVAKFGSLPRAVASSFKVLRVSGAELTNATMDSATNSVLAMALLLLPALAVGTEVAPVIVTLVNVVLVAVNVATFPVSVVTLDARPDFVT